jgi:hypothetical protein
VSGPGAPGGSGLGAGGPGGGIGPGTGGAGGGVGGGYTPNPRGPTSRVELKIAWEFPTYVEKVVDRDGRTASVHARRALSTAEAFAFISGEDRRPLLVLRECLKCNGTDDALMTRKQDNERTLLMSRWFHCIKLPPDVLEEDHPFHALFAGEMPGHLFLARWDGTERKDLNGQQSRTELWGLMESYLAAAYEDRVDSSLKPLLALLDRFDRIDEDLVSVKDQIDELIEKGQAESNKLRKLQDKLTDLEEAKTRAKTEAVRLSDLKLKQQESQKSAGVPAAAGPPKG